MNKVVRKSLIVAMKLLVLTGILWYSFSQMQMHDELALPAPGTEAARAFDPAEPRNATPAYALSSVAGETVRVPVDTRLTVLSPPTAADTTYRVELPGGQHATIPAGQVDGPAAVYCRLPGLRSTLSDVRVGYLLAAFGTMGIPALIIGLRWLMLLRSADAQVPFWIGMRLHYLGLFFNTFMPGGTGGDIIKGVAVTRVTHRRAAAVSMILVDRVIGMMMVLLVPAATLLIYPDITGRMARVVGLLLTAVIGGSLLFFSPRFRRLIRWDTLLAKLPRAGTFQRIDQAMYGLRKRKLLLLGAFGLSLAVQLFSVLAVYWGGLAVGVDDARLHHYLLFVPAGLLANAIPISFGGIGLMEGAMMEMLSNADLATPAQGFMVGVVSRMTTVFWALPGGIVALTGFGAAARHAARDEVPGADALVPEPTGTPAS